MARVDPQIQGVTQLLDPRTSITLNATWGRQRGYLSDPYKLVSRQHHPDRSTVWVRGVPIGPDTFTLAAGPCAVETPEQTLEAARMARLASAMSPVKMMAANSTITTERGLSGDTALAKRCQERPRFPRAQAETRARR